jgi:hypothetical protein
MKISLRAIRGIKLLAGSPILERGGLPRYASTVTPRRRLVHAGSSFSSPAVSKRDGVNTP